jgi:hypothetical protein
MTTAVRLTGAGARSWVEARALAAHAGCQEGELVDAINAGTLPAYRINRVLLVPATAASEWLAGRSAEDGGGDAPAWDPYSPAARWPDGTHAEAVANLLTVPEAAAILDVTPNRVYGIIRTRRMAGRVVNGRIWVDPADIADYQLRYPRRVRS